MDYSIQVLGRGDADRAPGASQYAAPLPGLYLCGAGSHPGGGVMGAAGFNAAQRILGDGGAP